jgi:flagellar hook-associated protein 3
MRITPEFQSQTTLLNIQNLYAKLNQLQSQISTGNRLSAVSDDPLSAVQIQTNNATLSQYTTTLNNIQTATNTIQTGVDVLTQTQTLLSSVMSLAKTANSAVNQPAANSAIAGQVNAALNQLLSLANTQLSNGTYIFGGAANTKPPFVVSSTNGTGQPGVITYQGSQLNSQAIIAPNQSVSTLIAGNQVFQPTVGGPTSYFGNTGATAGTGVDTASGVGTLIVQHTLTTYAGGSGISPGASSANDTVIGPSGANNLTVTISADGKSGTVSLNGGSPVSFDNTQTDLKVTGPSGEVLSLDTTGITAGFQGNVAVEGDGSLSVDGGLTSVPIDFSANQIITDGNTGAVTNVNSTNIRIAGNAQLQYPGPTDLFQSLIALRDTINNTQGLNFTDRQTAINEQISNLEKINASIATPLGNQSSQAQFLSNLNTHTTNLQLKLQEANSSLKSTDMAAALVDLQTQQNLYQASLQVAAKIDNLSLANFITP